MSAISGPGRQQSITEAIAAAQSGAEGDDSPDTLQDDRVVDDGLTCHCGRPAGADGLCTACRMDSHGEQIAGRRL